MFVTDKAEGAAVGALYARELGADQTKLIQPSGFNSAIRVYRISKVLQPATTVATAGKQHSPSTRALALLSATKTTTEFANAVNESTDVFAVLLPTSAALRDALSTLPMEKGREFVLAHVVRESDVEKALLLDGRGTLAAKTLGGTTLTFNNDSQRRADTLDARVIGKKTTVELNDALRAKGFKKSFVIWSIPFTLGTDATTSSSQGQFPFEVPRKPTTDDQVPMLKDTARSTTHAGVLPVDVSGSEAAPVNVLTEAKTTEEALAAVSRLSQRYDEVGGAAEVRKQNEDVWQKYSASRIDALNRNLMLTTADKTTIRAALENVGVLSA